MANRPLATYADAVALRNLTQRTSEEDLDRFSPADRAILDDLRITATAIVDAGPAAFDDADVVALLSKAGPVVDALTRLPCDGFLPS